MKKVFLIAACIIISQVTISQPVQESSPQKIKILSWNIYMLPGFLAKLNGQRAGMIGKVLSQSDYDVIVFQEAFCPWARHHLRRQLDSSFSYQAGPANRKWFSIKTNSGLWILSKHPIMGYHSIAFRTKHGIDALSRKGALLVELLVNGSTIQVTATHLQNSGGIWLRHAQCVELYERLLKPNVKEGVPQIVCGDFNIDKHQSEESYRFMLTSLGATDGMLMGETQCSYDRKHNDLQIEKGKRQDLIDYILVRENGGWVDCATRRIKVIRKPWHSGHRDLSDHYSIEAEICFANFRSVISSR